VVKPEQKKEIVREFKHKGISERSSCTLVGLSRSGYRKPLQKINDAEDLSMIKEMAEKFPRSGYEQLFQIYRNKEGRMNHKRFYRLYKQGGLALRRIKRRQKINRERVPLNLPEKENQVWSMDFQFDSESSGRKIKFLNIIDDCSKKCVWIEIDYSIGTLKLIRTLQNMVLINGKPEAIRTDNGPEFTSKDFILWAEENQIKHLLIQPGKPNQNAYIESFNSRLRYECLQAHIFKDLESTREIVENWREFYNEVRPHQSLNGMSPNNFIKLNHEVVT